MKQNIIRILTAGLIFGAVLIFLTPMASACGDKDYYQVTVLHGLHGTTDPQGTFEVPDGTDVVIKMIPDLGYTVDSWSVDGAPFDSPGRGPDVDGKTIEYKIPGICADTLVEVTFTRLTTEK